MLIPESSDKPRHRERSVAISPFPLRLPRTLRVLAMTLSNRIYASYRWIGVIINTGTFHSLHFIAKR